MKMHATLAAATLAIITICFFAGCEKAFDYLKNHPGENAQLCQVQKLEFSWPFGPPGEISVKYNVSGNPTDMIVTSTGIFNTAEFHFRYDKYGRLTDNYFNYRGGTGVLIWHEYTYRDKKTVIDTVYAYTGLISDPVHPRNFAANGNRVVIYSLDASGRIIKTTEPDIYGSSPPLVTNFTYDAQGNRIRPGVIYDNKVNVYQTNKVWMFIYNDYSVNNPLSNPPYTSASTAITGYNPLGLPLTMASSQGYIFDYNFFNLQIVYDCDQSKAPVKW